MTPEMAFSCLGMLEPQGKPSKSPIKVAGLICPPCQAPSSKALTSVPLGGHAKKLSPCQQVGLNGEIHGLVGRHPLESRAGLGHQMSQCFG